MTHLTVEAAGPSTIPVDACRFGHARWGIATSGPFDRSAHAAANAAVGNHPGAATLELLAGGLRLRADRAVVMCLTGAAASIRVNGLDLAHSRPFAVPAGGTIEITTAPPGLRHYLAVAGGFDVPAVLGSRSYDTLAGLGPSPLAPGAILAVGHDVAPSAHPRPAGPRPPGPVAVAGSLVLDLLPAPRPVPPAVLAALTAATWRVSERSDRVALRLTGPVIGPLAPVSSEGVVAGAVQLPPNGQPLIFGPDHPLTGGYPVLGVVASRSLDALAHLPAGTALTFRPDEACP